MVTKNSLTIMVKPSSRIHVHGYNSGHITITHKIFFMFQRSRVMGNWVLIVKPRPDTLCDLGPYSESVLSKSKTIVKFLKYIFLYVYPY